MIVSPEPGTINRRAPLKKLPFPVTPVATITCYAASLSLLQPYLALRLEQAGHSTTLIGAMAGVAASGILLMPLLLPSLLRLFSSAQMLTTCFLFSILLFPIYRLSDSLIVWSLVNFFISCCAASLFMISEAWLVQGTQDSFRGFSTGIFVAFTSIGFVTGPLALAFVGLEGWLPIAWLMGISAFACILTWIVEAPTFKLSSHASLANWLNIVRVIPLVYIIAFVFGALEFAVISLLAPYALQLGADISESAQILSVFYIGGAVLTLAFGLLADRLRMNWLLSGSLALMCLSSLLLNTLIIEGGWVSWAVIAIWGGTVSSLYCVGLIILGNIFKNDHLLEANSFFSLFYGLGALVGPLIAGFSIDLWPSHGFVVFLAGTALFLMALTVSNQKIQQVLVSPR